MSAGLGMEPLAVFNFPVLSDRQVFIQGVFDVLIKRHLAIIIPVPFAEIFHKRGAKFFTGADH